MSYFRSICFCQAAAVCLAAALPAADPALAAAQERPRIQSGDSDPFYAQPRSFVDRRPGEVLKSRAVSIPGLPGFVAYQLQYISTDTSGAAQADVATVILPKRIKEPLKLVSFQPPIDALSFDCDPSYKLRAGTEGDVGKIAILLARGWAVVVPDFLGPDHQWVAGYVEARGTLDGIRAAENFGPAGLRGKATQVAMTGYSGGARGTEFANELAAAYAPELKLVGAASGGLAVDVGDVLEHLNGSPVAGIAFAGFLGISRAYPTIGIDKLLNAKGREMRAAIGRQCIENFAGAYPNDRIQSFTVGGVDPWSLPRVGAAFEKVKGGSFGNPEAPSYFYVGSRDELVVPEDLLKLARKYCQAGYPVRYVVLPGDHRMTDQAGFAGAVDWIAARFAGQRDRGTCQSLN